MRTDFPDELKKGAPDGFAVTARAFDDFIRHNGLRDKIIEALQNVADSKEVGYISEAEKQGELLRDMVMKGEFSPKMRDAIINAYGRLSQVYGEAGVASSVRASTTLGDSPQHPTAFLHGSSNNVAGEEEILARVKEGFASNFTDRAITNNLMRWDDEDRKTDRGYLYMAPIAVGTEKFCGPRKEYKENYVSGVVMTTNPDQPVLGTPSNYVVVTANYGTGNSIKTGGKKGEGGQLADTWYYSVEGMKTGTGLMRKVLGEKKHRTTPESGDDFVEVDEELRDQFCMSDETARQLALDAIRVHEHETKKRGEEAPMSVDFVWDGKDISYVQKKPLTTQVFEDPYRIDEYVVDAPPGEDLNDYIIGKGQPILRRVGRGQVTIARTLAEVTLDPKIAKAQGKKLFGRGGVLIAEVSPDWAHYIAHVKNERIVQPGTPLNESTGGITRQRIDFILGQSPNVADGAILIDGGGIMSHAAILARSERTPTVIGVKVLDKATGSYIPASQALKDGDEVTVGPDGTIYAGLLPFHILRTIFDPVAIPQTGTGLKFVLGAENPWWTFDFARLPNDGCGLMRLEFAWENAVGSFPSALLNENWKKIKADERNRSVYVSADPARAEIICEIDTALKEVEKGADALVARVQEIWTRRRAAAKETDRLERRELLDEVGEFLSTVSEATAEGKIAAVRKIVDDAKKKDVQVFDLIAEIEKRTRGYSDDEKERYIVDQLASDCAIRATALRGKDMHVRTLDSTDEECRMMPGNLHYEPGKRDPVYYFPPSSNPLIAIRGGSLYTDSEHEPWFRLHLEAIYTAKFIRGFHDIKVMFPFVQSAEIHDRLTKIDREERKKVLDRAKEMRINVPKEIAEQNPWNMLELPANVAEIENFSRDRSGLYIGLDDVVMTTHGVTRELTEPLVDEGSLASTRLLESAIDYCHKHDIPIGCAGSAVGEREDFLKRLVEWGISSVSVPPGRSLEVLMQLAKAEQEVAQERRIEELYGVVPVKRRGKVLRLVDEPTKHPPLHRELGLVLPGEPGTNLVEGISDLGLGELERLRRELNQGVKGKVDKETRALIDREIKTRKGRRIVRQ